MPGGAVKDRRHRAVRGQKLQDANSWAAMGMETPVRGIVVDLPPKSLRTSHWVNLRAKTEIPRNLFELGLQFPKHNMHRGAE